MSSLIKIFLFLKYVILRKKGGNSPEMQGRMIVTKETVFGMSLVYVVISIYGKAKVDISTSVGVELMDVNICCALKLYLTYK